MQSRDYSELVTTLKGVNLYFIGMMGAGKTTVGRIVARRLGYQFFDTDALIEQMTGQTIPQIFADSGEETFRDLETQVLSELSAYTRLAIATGGGTIVRRTNWSYLHHGIVIWLDASVDQLFQRIKHSTHRPLIQTPDPQKRLQDLLEQRRSRYAEADVHIQALPDEPPDQMAQRVLEAVYERLRRPELPPDLN
jgi:shikimate kinase